MKTLISERRFYTQIKFLMSTAHAKCYTSLIFHEKKNVKFLPD